MKSLKRKRAQNPNNTPPPKKVIKVPGLLVRHLLKGVEQQLKDSPNTTQLVEGVKCALYTAAHIAALAELQALIPKVRGGGSATRGPAITQIENLNQGPKDWGKSAGI